MMRAKLQRENILVNLVQDSEVNVNLCDGNAIKEELLVNFTNKREHVMILDIGAPVSLFGRPWLDQYLKEFDLTIDDFVASSCSQVFQFGPSKRYESKILIDLPLVV